MEEATGAPSSLADYGPKRLRASGRDRAASRARRVRLRRRTARGDYTSSAAGARHRRCARRDLRDFVAGAGLADRRDAERFLDPHEPVEHLLVDAVGLLVEVRDLELGLDVDLVFDVGPHAVFRGLAVLADQHEARQED